MTHTGERDAAFTLRPVKVHIRPRRNKEACERAREVQQVPQPSRKGTRVYTGERRRAAKCFASRGPEWLSPNERGARRIARSRIISCNAIRSPALAKANPKVISRVRKLFRPHLF